MSNDQPGTGQRSWQPAVSHAGPALASWGARVGANVLDQLVTSIPGTVGLLVFLAGFGYSDSAPGNGVETPSGGELLLTLVGCLLSLALWIWNRGLKQGRTGRSIGKQVLGLRLVREADGGPTGVGTALLRDVAHIVDGAPMDIGYLWPLWDPKKQTFAPTRAPQDASAGPAWGTAGCHEG